jgi:hypothetical protein
VDWRLQKRREKSCEFGKMGEKGKRGDFGKEKFLKNLSLVGN